MELKGSFLLILIVELVIASVEDIRILPGAIVRIFEAANFTHLISTRPGYYIKLNWGGHRKYSPGNLIASKLPITGLMQWERTV